MERQVWLEKIKRSAKEFTDIPQDLKCKEFYLEALRKNNFVYHYLPLESKLDLGIAVVALKNGLGLDEIPRQFLADNLNVLWKAALSCPVGLNRALQTMPLEMLTLEMCWEAVNSKPFLIRYVPEYMQTEDMAKYAAREEVSYIMDTKYDNYQWYMKIKNEGIEVSRYTLEKAREREEADAKDENEVEADAKDDAKDEDKNEDAKCAEGELECVICMDNKRCMLFMPCRHVVSCKTCSEKLDKCPICKQQIKYKQQIIIS